LHLYADLDRQLPSTDPDRRDLMLSCGAALHHCVVALAAMGWQAKVHRFPNPAEPEHLAAVKVHRHPATELDVTLAAAIPRRRTDRRHYSSWYVPAGDITVMGTRAASTGVMLREVLSLPKLRRIVAQAVWQHATDDDYVAELTTWSGQNASVAGVRPATYRPPIRRRRCRADCSPVLHCPSPPIPNRQTTTRSCWRWAPKTTLRWPDCAPARPPAWCC
jgi:hypothetical protein